MAWAPCSWTAAFRRCARLGAARLTSPATQHLRPSEAPTSRALVNTWRRTTTPPPACNARPRGAVVAAAVEVVVVDTTREHDVEHDCDGGSAPVLHVYGSVTAKTSAASGNFPKEHSLFHREKGQLARVPRGAPIPLQTTAVLVSAPLCSDSELQVSAELLDASASWQNPDREIARGSVVFAPRLAGTDTAEIAGADGRVRVDVSWSTE